MRKLLIGLALGAAASTISFMIGGTLAQEEETQSRTVIIFYDNLRPVEYYETAPEYEHDVAAVGEELTGCGTIKLHFVPASTIPDGPPASVAIFLDEVNSSQKYCIQQIMKEGSVGWYIDEVAGPIELGLENF